MKRIPFINEEQKRIQDQRARLATLLHLSESQLQLVPKGTWSVSDCIHHMLLASRPYIDRIEKKLASAKKSENENFKRGLLGSYFTFGMLPKPNGEIKNRMKTMSWFDPAKTSKHPEYRGLQPHDLVKELDAIFNRASVALDLAKTYDLNENKITSTLGPIVRLKLGDAFAFMNAHNERHLLQVKGILTAINPSEEKS